MKVVSTIISSFVLFCFVFFPVGREGGGGGGGGGGHTQMTLKLEKKFTGLFSNLWESENFLVFYTVL